MSNLKRIAEIGSRFAGKTILVFGDVILDRYIFGEVERISPEAPVPVVTVEREESRLGGAGNVAANIDSLGARALLLGVSGDDGFAEEIARLKADGNLVVRDAAHPTVVKTRIISQRQQIVRIDREGRRRPGAAALERMRAAIAAEDIDGIIVSDYAKGAVNGETMDLLKARAAESGIPIVVDPKPPHFALYRGVTGLTPNLREAGEMSGRPIADDAGAADALKRIRRRYRTRFAIITRGAQGISASERGRRTFHLPACSREVFDVTGAGDTVVAVLTLALVSGADLREAVALANAAASIVVEKVGTSQIGLEELQQRLRLIQKKR
ncbi:MAG: bifunctional hydroxymethylpyrimidine kinase/phosphomethylpyrimidine kinase [Candidatus Aminicenantes bacterium]|nr:bifunctional hydroxymethylpyrimidine kinase/phosphomethylpyrimidine kinase [Candidatus Aminicenantes bacterium]